MTTTEAALAGWALLVLLVAAIAGLVARRARGHGEEETTKDG